MSISVLKRTPTTINRKYSEYFLPTVLTAMATNIAVIVDAAVAGNLLGKNALSAINLLSPVAQLYFSLTIMFGLGASSVISIAKGKNDSKKVNHVFTTAVTSIFLLSTLLIAIQLPLADGICSMLTGDSVLHSLMYKYYIPFILGTPLNLLILCSVHFLRIDNRPKFASGIIIIANVVNLLMDFVYMGIFDMGIAGSSIATVTGYAVGFIIMLTHFLSKRSSLRFDFSIFKAPKRLFQIFSNLVAVGLSGALGTLLITVKMFLLNWIIQTTGGRDAVLSYSICASSQIFMSLFITGASQTMIPIIGVCLGEKDYDGVRYAFRRAAAILTIASTAIVLFIEISPEPVIRMFGVTAESDITNIMPALRISALAFPAQAFSFLFLYYYMAIQKKTISTIISIVNGIAIIIPSAWLLSSLLGIIGVWTSLVVSQVGTLIVIFFIIITIKKKSSGKYNSFYLLQDNDDDKTISLSFKGTSENASCVSMYLSAFLTAHGVDKSKANRIAVAVEGITADIAQRSCKKRKPDIDIRIKIDSDETLISIRDNGDLYDIVQEDSKDDNQSDIKVVKAVSKSVEYYNVLGFNRIIIKL